MAERNNCPFCDLPDEPAIPYNVRRPVDGGDVSIMTGLGMLMPGHLLTVTKEHLTSFAQMDREWLKEFNESLQKHLEYLSKFFGTYVTVEHGSDNIDRYGSGGCIVHAHQHLIPDLEVGEHMQEQLPWEQLDSYEDLAELRGRPYIYLGKLGMHYAVANPKLQGQWTRRQIAEVRGLDNWDWMLEQGAFNLIATFVKLNEFPDRKLMLDIKNDKVEFIE
jgi:diadenosine tetraphosphate (Ap4A) HIT family hydrolase